MAHQPLRRQLAGVVGGARDRLTVPFVLENLRHGKSVTAM
jgi:hypothetical protein